MQHMSFEDNELCSLVTSLVDQVERAKQVEEDLAKPKFKKMSSGFTVKGALNISIGSTSCSDEGNSLERSTLPRSRGFRSSSMNLSEGVKQGLPHSLNKNSEGLSKIPELATTFFCESMNQTEINSEISYGSSPSPNSEAASQMGNTKRPAPNKYKTEICRNWQLEGYCRFGDECTFAHGGDELNRKATMPLNYKTKVCKQFTEEPYYCPYGEKCQFIHVNITKKYQATNRTPTYNEMLNETLAQIDNRLKHCNNFEEFELPKSHFRKARLTIFSAITENLNDAKEKDEKEPGSPTPPNKKTSLKLGSKAFHMPIKSPKESSGKDDAIIS